MRRIAWRRRHAPHEFRDDGEIIEIEPDGQVAGTPPRHQAWEDVGYTPAPDPGSTAGIWEALRHS